MEEIGTIQSLRGAAAFVQTGQYVTVVNTHGEQVVDTWAFVRHDLREFMSMEHTRATLVKIMPTVGDYLYTTRRRPILKIVEDTSPGIHDTLMAACDNYRYGLLGCTEYHDNCTDNLWAAMHGLGLTPPETPSPLNLFMNIPWQSGGALSFDPPVTRPGDSITLEAQLDAVVAFSACPQDILPINGKAGRPTEAHFRIHDAGARNGESAA
ncbi:MAG: urea carboxylase-associated family protein [Thiotrichales bacterium]|nr:urea carboxylase-associated family protein [Thiotrichales bacterium]